MAISLKKLFQQDQEDRKLNWEDPTVRKEVVARDRKRLQQVYWFINSNRELSPKDKYFAAMILQHADKPEDYQQANRLAKEAMEDGYNPAKWLYAATLDRYLLSQKKPQLFGTQFEKKGGKWQLSKYEPLTTDKQRKKYGVPPIKEQLKTAQKLSKQ